MSFIVIHLLCLGFFGFRILEDFFTEIPCCLLSAFLLSSSLCCKLLVTLCVCFCWLTGAIESYCWQVIATSVHVWCSSALMVDLSAAFPCHVDQMPVSKPNVVWSSTTVADRQAKCWKESRASMHTLSDQTRRSCSSSCLALYFWSALVCLCAIHRSVPLHRLNHRFVCYVCSNNNKWSK